LATTAAQRIFHRAVVRQTRFGYFFDAMRPQRLQTALGHLLRRIDPEDRMRAYRVWLFWAEEVGHSIADHAQPVALRAGVLTVAVDAPTWLQELQFLKTTLLERLNGRLGETLIDDIYFISGSVTRTARRAGTETTSPPLGPTPDPLPPLRNPEFAAAFARIVEARARRARREG
jgi:predicted nucleic acid-binding Zn ribbon protein